MAELMIHPAAPTKAKLTARDRAAKRAARLHALLVRWGRVRADLDQLIADTPAQYRDSINDVSDTEISGVLAVLGVEYAVAAAEAF